MSDSDLQKRLRHDNLKRLVKFEAWRIHSAMPPGAIEYEELVAYGFLGLCEAQRRFDPDRKIKLETFVRHRIRGAMLDGLRTGLGLAGRRAYRRLKRQVLSHDGKPIPRMDAKALDDVTFGQIAELVNTLLEAHVEEAGSLDPERYLATRQERQSLRRALRKLNTDDQQVVRAIYDFDGVEDSGAELARRRGVHRSKVSRQHRSILQKLRRAMLSFNPSFGWTGLRVLALGFAG